MTEPEYEPLTDEEIALDREITERATRDILAALSLPPAQVHHPEKFGEPIGLDDQGEYQPPLTDEERAHNEQARQPDGP